MKNIIYLDFDGVLHPACPTETNQFCALPYFESVIEPFVKEKNIKIIISSSWRMYYGIENLIDIFKNDIIKKSIIGTTPMIKHINNKYYRSEEIEASIEEIRPDNYIIIDDAKDAIEKKYWNKCVITNAKKGFDYKAKQKFIEIASFK